MDMILVSLGLLIHKETVSGANKKYVCKLCGYIYEGPQLPSDFVCPLCKRGAEVFEEMT